MLYGYSTALAAGESVETGGRVARMMQSATKEEEEAEAAKKKKAEEAAAADKKEVEAAADAARKKAEEVRSRMCTEHRRTNLSAQCA